MFSFKKKILLTNKLFNVKLRPTINYKTIWQQFIVNQEDNKYNYIYNITESTSINEFFFLLNFSTINWFFVKPIKFLNNNFLELFGFLKIKYFVWQKNILIFKNINLNIESPLIVLLEKKNQKIKYMASPFFLFFGLFLFQQQLFDNQFIKGLSRYFDILNFTITWILYPYNIVIDNIFFSKIIKKKNFLNQILYFSKIFNELLYISNSSLIFLKNIYIFKNITNFLNTNNILIDGFQQKIKNSYKLFNNTINNIGLKNESNIINCFKKCFYLDSNENFYEKNGIFLTNCLELINQTNKFLIQKKKKKNFFIFSESMFFTFELFFINLVILSYSKIFLKQLQTHTINILKTKQIFKFQFEQIYTYHYMLTNLKMI